MDFGMASSAGVIASSTTVYLSAFSPVFLLVGGIVLAFTIMEFFIDTVSDRRDRDTSQY